MSCWMGALIAFISIDASGVSNLPTALSVPGGVAILEVPGEPSKPPVVTFEGNRVMVIPNGQGWRAIVGIPLAREPGTAKVEIRSGNATLTQGFTIEGKAYATQRLKVAPKHVDLSPDNAARVAEEQPRIREAVGTFSTLLPSTLRLESPVRGPRSSSFGLRRVIRTRVWISQRRSAHPSTLQHRAK